MAKTTFLILHGWMGSGPEHWQTYLAKTLQETEANVLYPNLPNADEPKLSEWLETIENLLKDIKDPLVVIAHSLGGPLWLHYLATHTELQLKQVFLVSPPLYDQGIPEIADFFPLPQIDLSS